MGTPHYQSLTAPERFALMLEAMARGDEREADLLEDTCPKHVYRCDDAEFRDRMKRAYNVVMAVALNMRAGFALVEMAENFRRLSGHSDGPITPAQWTTVADKVDASHLSTHEAGGFVGTTPRDVHALHGRVAPRGRLGLRL